MGQNTDSVSGGPWGRRLHTAGELTKLASSEVYDIGEAMKEGIILKRICYALRLYRAGR